ncbi:DEAD (Asp-Glu-Ala-Asp) box polypeptide 41 [Perkinsus olseni]|uniref:RNA helicase n=1 Tax=Perkinsus olseni TaxID=32597 RepID=A0A7J6LV82_PEROL|nr:DEAD (Asp-Glu-Ala-Asp) box polypeptide 41 [Perkinsus olseni]
MATTATTSEAMEAFLEEAEKDEDEELYIPRKFRKKTHNRRLPNKSGYEASASSTPSDSPAEEEAMPSNVTTTTATAGGASLSAQQSRSLLFESMKMKKAHDEMPEEAKVEEEKRAKEEQERTILRDIEDSMSKPLTSVVERAKGITYDSSMPNIAGWTLPKKYRDMTEEEAQAIRDKFFIEINGHDVCPPVKSFKDMLFPQGILEGLKSKGISRPTQIQMQGLPEALLGRDLIGIAFTGSGKTLVFAIPAILRALEMEMRSPVTDTEGPFCLLIAPSRELAQQTHEVVEHYVSYLTGPESRSRHRLPRLRCHLCIGGESLGRQAQNVRRGVHIITATPGRLNHMLNEKMFTLAQCVYICLDEADRMVDLGFEDEVRNTLDHFGHQRQTLLFSATMPRKIQEFATSALVNPVEYVKAESKLTYLLQCLQKTAPPVMVFCSDKASCDEVLEYLLLKGVGACAIHGGLEQSERHKSTRLFKSGVKDVLIGTDVASKGLDFPAIQHVINYDMPKEIDNYVHRIGRTGRCGRTGVATTFINKSVDETVLLDLKAILQEAGQRVPPFLEHLEPVGGEDTAEVVNGIRGCAYCGGLGHRIKDCPKLEQARRQTSRPSDEPIGGQDCTRCVGFPQFIYPVVVGCDMSDTEKPREKSEESTREGEEEEEFQRAMELVERRLRDMDADYEATLAAEKPKEGDKEEASAEELGYDRLCSDSSDDEEEFGAFVSGQVVEESKGDVDRLAAALHLKPMSPERRQRIREAMASIPQPDAPEWARGLSDEEFLKAAVLRRTRRDE